MKKAIPVLCAALLGGGTVLAETAALSNRVATLEVNLQGGGIVRFERHDIPLNPFSWRSRWNPGCEGFFLCFDRLGKPSEEDGKRGIPLHGEAHAQRWEVVSQSRSVLRVRCELPVAKMSVEREYRLFPGSSVCKITDTFRNNNDFAKPYNILLHPSLGPPFLVPGILVDCNAATGFPRLKGATNYPGETVKWPLFKGEDLRHLERGEGGVVNFCVEPYAEYGWATITNPKKKLLVGYLWEPKDYPWIRLWREWDAQKPRALAVEFGTTPLGIPLEEVAKVGDILGQPTLRTLPPGGEVTHSFYLFLADIPADYKGTKKASCEPGMLILKERDSRRTAYIHF